MATVIGDKALIRKLRALPRVAENKVIRQSIRKGAKHMQGSLKSEAPIRTGLMRRLLGVKAIKRKKGRIGSQVTFRNAELLTSTSKAGRRYFYPAAVEYGHSGAEGLHWMRDEFDQQEMTTQHIILKDMKAGIEREAKSL